MFRLSQADHLHVTWLHVKGERQGGGFGMTWDATLVEEQEGVGRRGTIDSSSRAGTQGRSTVFDCL